MKLEIGMISAAALLGLAASVVILMGAGGGETADTGYTESDINSASHYSRSSVKTIEIHRAEDEMQELTDISECTITLKKKSSEKPEVEVSCNETALIENEDYSLTYEKDGDTAGKHYVNVEMQGKYKGNTLLSYEIKPEAPSVTLYRVRTSDITVRWKADDKCTGCELEYSMSKDFENSKKVSLKNSDTEYTIKGLEKNKSYYLRMRSIVRGNDNEDVFSDWSSSKYEELKKIEVKDGVTYVDGIIIVNKTYGLPSGYGSGEDPEALRAFNEMCSGASVDGIYLYLASGYRSYSLQEGIYNEFVDERGTEGADRVSARPGHSEHQTGLAFDINTTASSFNYTPEAAWIAEHCHEYGFIVRYPEDKEEITGYAYESWHVRYVGKELSKKVTESGLTLEEYYGLTSEYENR